eukprot:gene27083-53462_t
MSSSSVHSDTPRAAEVESSLPTHPPDMGGGSVGSTPIAAAYAARNSASLTIVTHHTCVVCVADHRVERGPDVVALTMPARHPRPGMR